MNILEEIVEHKRVEVAREMASMPMADLPEPPSPPRDFVAALSTGDFQIIAEVKLKSASAGEMGGQLDIVAQSKAYETGGAAAVSVLTDADYFGGSLEHLAAVKAGIRLPVMRKDFIISEYQVRQSYSSGADAILLIADVLETDELQRLHELAQSLGLAALVEGYGDAALEKIRDLSPPITGINARNLSTMETDLIAMLERRQLLPAGGLQVAESGMATAEDVAMVVFPPH